jgi:chromosome transmission fidelity protein 18
LEGLRADTRALSTLVGVAKGDLRGCLNTLQVCTYMVYTARL